MGGRAAPEILQLIVNKLSLREWGAALSRVRVACRPLPVPVLHFEP